MGCSNSSSVVDYVEHDTRTKSSELSNPVLQRASKDFAGDIHGPSMFGLQVAKCTKWVGAFHDKSKDASWELRTIFLPSTLANKGLKERVLGTSKAFAEFVSFLEMSSGTWTISKVFLNGVLPSGQRLGAQAIAEHVTHNIAMNGGQPCGEANVEPFRKIKTIRLSDVVNWNTYMLMTIASSSARQSPNKVFGEHLAASLQQELLSAKTTLEELKTSDISEIFKRTALGKLVSNVLATWNNVPGVGLEMGDVKVIDGNGFENISGEMRRAIDILITVSSDDSLSDVGEMDSKGTRRQVTESTLASENDKW